MLKKLKNSMVLVVVMLVMSHPAMAEDVAEDFQTWGNITATGSFSSINPRLKWWLEGQGRFGDDSSRFSQGIIRPGIGYALNDKTSIWIGYGWFPTSKPFAGSPFNEHRIWQQLLWSDTFSFGTLTSRTRFEQRFFDIPGSTDTGYRFRQLVKLVIPLPEVMPNLGFSIWNEVFINTNDIDTGGRAGFNQNRIFGGLAYRFNKIAAGEFGYMNQYFNRPDNPRPDQMQHILAVTLSLKF